MTIINALASSQNRKDQVLNQQLAIDIANSNNQQAVEELIELLNHKTKSIQSDAIKALYEIGELKPELLVQHTAVFLNLLDSDNNRLQWGAMTALKTISPIKQKEIFGNLTKLRKIANEGSVITRDNYVYILTELGTSTAYKDTALEELNLQILQSASNQVPMYGELALPIIDAIHRDIFIHSLQLRREDMEKESKQKRIDKIISKLLKIK